MWLLMPRGTFASAKGYVVKAGPKFEIIGGHLGGYDFGAGASLAVSAGRIYVRDGQEQGQPSAVEGELQVCNSLQRSTVVANVKRAAQIDGRSLAVCQMQNVPSCPDEPGAIGRKAKHLVRQRSYALHHPTLPRLRPVPHVQRVPAVLIRDFHPKFNGLWPTVAGEDRRIGGAGKADGIPDSSLAGEASSVSNRAARDFRPRHVCSHAASSENAKNGKQAQDQRAANANA